ncbi:aromatic ring-hydroxylating oxygenase subunit alpha [Mycobacterium branderi]|uniref:Rieske domain-containing protein n=1 Tax=Mycobacterium branderi TaxID=43348 RepID=A0ABN6AX35_9MYCO|nr:aromatic ring-hydroxylating dioxygenase subunit alpha [Mycobacterium branderi]MCV7232920.1 aromatic ring-hydroxylating dioxygenase subunit alpha [Mycobacterium branderi]BBZ10025.1 hypothetical protein MBRA_02200 [Mycobacterium branderi]
MTGSVVAPEARLSPAQRLEAGPMVADLDTSKWPMKLDPERYWSQEFADLERDRLWPHAWQIACHESEIPEPGYWFEYTLLDQSYLIVRGNDNEIRAFVNACRHRGNALCEGHGHSARLTCPFHLWQYELDGRLRRISDEKEFGACDKANLALIPVQTGLFGGFVFINPDHNAPSLDDYLGDDVKALLEPYRMEELIPLGFNVSQSLAANWKVGIEAFIEQYHVHAIHPQVLTTSDDQQMHYGFFGDHNVFTVAYAVPSPRLGKVTPERIVKGFGSMAEAIQGPGALNPMEELVTPYRDEAGKIAFPPGISVRTLFQQANRAAAETDGQDVSGLTDNQMSDAHSWLLFPNTSMVVRARETLLFRFRPDPSGDPNRCIFDVVNYQWVPPKDREKLATPHNWVPEDHSLGLVLDQDREQIPRQQRGLRNRGLKKVVFARNEARIGHFHQTLNRYLGIETAS